jgi:L-ascorbate metabolism protein UlaG (beta-lactamase superfamily)
MRYVATLLFLTCAGWAQAPKTIDFQTREGTLKLTAIRHASLMLEAGGKVVQVDPVGAEQYGSLPKADLVLVTDTHGDHLDAKALDAVKKAGTVAVAPAAAKLDGSKVLANGETATVGPFRIEATPMYNLTRGPSAGQLYHPKGRGNGYLVTYGGFRLLIAGDTEGTPELKATKNIDAVLLPMNLPFTMPPEEAAEAVKAMKPKVAIPYHYRGSDLSVFEKALAGSGVTVKLLDWYR